eukprot:comp22333_c0_seq1/m.53684 comp22333_c0_seq1/g.53684  ORF comp22333_c0_seq1/g.53684 comp22333_c0_seq1/m.53684 type:complete len:429 (+) comp22333_c0_seq1:153-1439(+)
MCCSSTWSAPAAAAATCRAHCSGGAAASGRQQQSDWAPERHCRHRRRPARAARGQSTAAPGRHPRQAGRCAPRCCQSAQGRCAAARRQRWSACGPRCAPWRQAWWSALRSANTASRHGCAMSPARVCLCPRRCAAGSRAACVHGRFHPMWPQVPFRARATLHSPRAALRSRAHCLRAKCCSVRVRARCAAPFLRSRSQSHSAPHTASAPPRAAQQAHSAPRSARRQPVCSPCARRGAAGAAPSLRSRTRRAAAPEPHRARPAQARHRATAAPRAAARSLCAECANGPGHPCTGGLFLQATPRAAGGTRPRHAPGPPVRAAALCCVHRSTTHASAQSAARSAAPRPRARQCGSRGAPRRARPPLRLLRAPAHVSLAPRPPASRDARRAARSGPHGVLPPAQLPLAPVCRAARDPRRAFRGPSSAPRAAG